MAAILDESGAPILDEALVLAVVYDEAGPDITNVNGLAAAVSVAAPSGAPFGQTGTPLDARAAMEFQARIAVTAQATMEFEAGQAVQTGLITLAEDPWTSMYPG